MESEAMLTPREKSLQPEKFSPEEDQTQAAASGRTASPTHYQPAIPTPPSSLFSALTCWGHHPGEIDRLVGLVVRRPPRERKVPGSNPACAGIFSGSSHTSDLKIGTPVATLPGAWRYRVSVGTGWPGVSILWLGEMESLICSFCLSVAARKIVWADPSLRYTSLLLGR